MTWLCGRVKEKIYQSAELVPRVSQWDQNAKSGQMGRSFSRMLLCVRAFGSVCSVLTDMSARGRRHWPLWEWVQCDPCTLAQERLMCLGDILEGHHAKPARATTPSLTLDGGLAKDLQPMQGGAVPEASDTGAGIQGQKAPHLASPPPWLPPAPAHGDLLLHQPRQAITALGVLQDCLLGQRPARQGRGSAVDGLEPGPYLCRTNPL